MWTGCIWHDVCRACRIEVEPVFAAWGLSLLRVGKLSEAREKFGGCLKMLMEKERKISMKSKAKSDAHVLPSARNNSEIEEHHRVRVEIVDKIVQILENSIFDQDLIVLQNQQIDFAYQILDQKTFSQSDRMKSATTGLKDTQD